MKVAVTTASGGLGSAIIKTLVSQIGKENVIGIARSPSKAEHLGVEIRKGDYNWKGDFINALHDIDVVLLVSGMDKPDNRIDQHKNVIEAAGETGVRKIVYTSIVGEKGKSTFDAVVNANRQTEEDIMNSGLEWSIGRNGLYIEPDVEYIDNYKKDGKIANCAGDGLCSYTTRDELAYAYSQMILNDDLNGRIFNLAGDPVTQQQLTDYINSAFGTHLFYEELAPEEYMRIQQELNGEFLGTILFGIYSKIRNGEFMIQSDYEAAAGRPHIPWPEYFKSIRTQ